MTEAAASRPPDSRRVLAGYFTLAGLYTLSAAAIWGVNTLFLLDAGAELLRGLRRECRVLGRHGRVRGADRRRRGHARAPRLLPPLRRGARRDDAALRRARGDRSGRRGVRRRLGRDGARVHVLLGGDGGVARRRARRDGLHGRARPRLRTRPAGHRRGDADRDGRRRAARPDRPLAAVRRPLRAPRSRLRRRVGRDARPRLHAASGDGPRAARGGLPQRPRGRPLRVVATLAAPPDARVARADGVPHLGVLCLAAVPARPARKRRDLDRGACRVGDRALDDRRQPARPGALAAVRTADDPPARRGGRRDVRGGRPRAGRVVLGRRCRRSCS